MSTYQSIFGAVFQVFIIAFIAAFLTRRRIIFPENTKSLSLLTVRVFLPSLIFSKNISGFSPESNPVWWVITFWSIALILIGVGIAWLFLRKRMIADRNLLPLAAMQNAGYIILPLGKSLFPGQYDEFASYVFLVILGVSPVLWSLGKYLISPVEGKGFVLREMITPPLIANLLSITLVLFGARSIVPQMILSPLTLLGEAAVPAGLFILGASLGEIGLKRLPPLLDTIKLFGIKFIVLPAIVVYILYMFPVFSNNNILRYVLILESASPPAVALILQAKAYKGDIQKLGMFIMIGYILSLFFMPFWIVVYEYLKLI
jgi:hypothetical protein